MAGSGIFQQTLLSFMVLPLNFCIDLYTKLPDSLWFSVVIQRYLAFVAWWFERKRQLKWHPNSSPLLRGAVPPSLRQWFFAVCKLNGRLPGLLRGSFSFRGEDERLKSPKCCICWWLIKAKKNLHQEKKKKNQSSSCSPIHALGIWKLLLGV